MGVSPGLNGPRPPAARGIQLHFGAKHKSRGQTTPASWENVDARRRKADASNQAAEVERLIGLGARRVDWRYPHGADYIVRADPDGGSPAGGELSDEEQDQFSDGDGGGFHRGPGSDGTSGDARQQSRPGR
jgi:hypothetical protein